MRPHDIPDPHYALTNGCALVRCAVEDVDLDPAFWRSQFAETGGVARLGRDQPNANFTITSGTCLA